MIRSGVSEILLVSVFLYEGNIREEKRMNRKGGRPNASLLTLGGRSEKAAV